MPCKRSIVKFAGIGSGLVLLTTVVSNQWGQNGDSPKNTVSDNQNVVWVSPTISTSNTNSTYYRNFGGWIGQFSVPGGTLHISIDCSPDMQGAYSYLIINGKDTHFTGSYAGNIELSGPSDIDFGNACWASVAVTN